LQALCDSLLARIAIESDSARRHVSAQSIARLAGLPLQGNVRELENILHRSVALSDEMELDIDEVTRSDTPAARVELAPPIPSVAPPTTVANLQAAALPGDLQGHLDAMEREILVRALRQTAFNRTLAANLLGLSLRQIRYRIARLKIEAPFAAGDDADDHA
jgi:two-component system response regulator PilR (NtrC family)